MVSVVLERVRAHVLEDGLDPLLQGPILGEGRRLLLLLDGVGLVVVRVRAAGGRLGEGGGGVCLGVVVVGHVDGGEGVQSVVGSLHRWVGEWVFVSISYCWRVLDNRLFLFGGCLMKGKKIPR